LFFLLALVARGGFGFGDVKLAFFLGLFLAFQSWEALGSGVFLAFMIGGGIALGLLVGRRRGRKDAIPFGPSMVAGAYAALLWGEQLVSWYLP
jgi:leader peptidase (prepilin peptidase)/N-methyltransferase